MSLAADIVAAIAADPEALAELRALLAEPRRDVSAAVYTPQTLAALLGRSPRSVRAAIHRGELDAVKRGRGYLISADAVDRWTATPRHGSPPDRARRAGSRDRGVMARALR